MNRSQTRRWVRRQVREALAGAYLGPFPVPSHRTVAEVDAAEVLPGRETNVLFGRYEEAKARLVIEDAEEYQGTSGTAREAPGAVSSGTATSATGGVPSPGEAGHAPASPPPLRRAKLQIDPAACSAMEQRAEGWRQ